MSPFVTLPLIVLLPIIPAYLLFRALPSTGNVAGRFQGLELKLSGSFAGYFALVLVIFQHYDKLFPPPLPPSAFVWHLTGHVVTSSGSPIELLDVKDFSFSPPLFQAIPGGNFKLTIPTEAQEGGGTAWPMLVISHDGFTPLRIPLSPSEMNSTVMQSLGASRDDGHKEIKMQNIILPSAPPYNPTGPKPKQISGPVKKQKGPAATKVNP